MVDAASIDPKSSGVEGGLRAYAAGSANSSQAPSEITTNIGSSLSAVVTTCTRPPVRAPSRLQPTKSHSSDIATTSGGTRASDGMALPRYPTTPTASAEFVIQQEIQ